MQIITPKKTKKSYKDCLLKGLILRSIKAGHTEARDIHTNINYNKSLNALYSEMSRLKNYGYVSIIKLNSISIYTLTKKGEQHAMNPFICVEQKEIRLKNIVDKNVMAILKDNDKMKQLAYEMALDMQKSSPSVITQQVPVTQTHEVPVAIPSSSPALSPALTNDDYAKQYLNLKEKPTISSQRYEDEYGNPITAEEHFKRLDKHSTKDAQRRKQMADRKKLAQKYFHHHIYSNFFEAWGNMRPVYLKTAKNIPRIDIIAKSNPEYNRNHVERELEKKEYDFIIYKIDEYGIYIVGGETLSVKLEQPLFMRF